MKILIIEDELDMLQNMKDFLEKENFVVETADSVYEAQNKIGVYSYDCILLDINLKDGSGFSLLEDLKKNNIEDGVIIVSARNSLDDKLEGLNLGADDYLAKPFHMSELNARVKAVLRRRQFKGNNKITIGNLSINLDEHEVSIDEKPLNLNRKEFEILLFFTSNQNRLVNKSALAEHVWGDHIDQADSFEFIYSQIKNLRKKLKAADADIEIKAVYGIGYKLVER
ncbi:response regulator transcription factor [Salegentibacter mishustinae]|uniref:Two-component system response regulator n=1 Tax=Salegentibacter mishustinae TaxID=270918 RepID=A0A0Q9ZF82_9FLAO|nr:response regulator transcription factor [Salegentibacter mishustinae]KRG28282.1 two-component system response regulator [Salegentibacter mishustinae]PNW22217.1 two-component system response regulator [Salegentibacter mishustinae]PZX67436.1 DNA-binding response OmpR family regulator [Salegentibacter mishustinae]GGW79744.1 DNA-binding response regulator [Salegentibacter mishustinae]